MKKLIFIFLILSYTCVNAQEDLGWVTPSTNVDSLRKVFMSRKPLPPVRRFTKYDSFVKPNFDADSIRYEFVKLYLQHCKKIGKETIYSQEMDTAVQFHLRYIVKNYHFDDNKPMEGKNSLHYEEPIDMRHPWDRISKLCPSLSYLKDGKVAEVCAGLEISGFVNRYYLDNNLKTNKDIALELYNNLMSSVPHKQIMEDKSFKYYNYGIIIDGDRYYVVGDFFEKKY